MLEESLLSFALGGVAWVLWLLVGLSLLCVAVAIERAVFLWQNRTPTHALNAALLKFTKADDLEQLDRDLQQIGGAESRVLIAGVGAAEKGARSVEEALAAAASIERMRRERLIFLLGTVGSNAPFIGLLGTVLGIIKAFQDLALNQAEAASAVMAGISEALVATAVGLLVAIPAVILFNLFQRVNRQFLGRVESSSHVLLAYLKADGVSATSGTAPTSAPANAEA